MTLAVSDLTGYLYCPRKLFLEKVLKLRSRDTAAALKGALRHDLYERLNKADETAIKAITKKEYYDIFEQFKKEYASILRKVISYHKEALKKVKVDIPEFYNQMFRGIINEAKVKARNILDFLETEEVYGDELWEKLTPKILVKVAVQDEELDMKGVVDKIEMHPDEIVPIEIKTGKAPEKGVWPGQKIQLFCYMLLAEKTFDKPVKRGQLYYLDDKETRELINTPFVAEDVKKTLAKTKEILESKKLPDFVENKRKCEKCPLKDQCYDSQFMEEKMFELLGERQEKLV